MSAEPDTTCYPDSPVAYCAPGYRAQAEQILRDHGEWPLLITEHPYLAGHTDVIITDVRHLLSPIPVEWSWP